MYSVILHLLPREIHVNWVKICFSSGFGLIKCEIEHFLMVCVRPEIVSLLFRKQQKHRLLAFFCVFNVYECVKGLKWKIVCVATFHVAPHNFYSIYSDINSIKIYMEIDEVKCETDRYDVNQKPNWYSIQIHLRRGWQTTLGTMI